MSKQIVEYHLARLKDKNPRARINSINELVLLGDAAALEVLREVFENDPDEDVRKAAQNAGRELFKKIRAQNEQAEDAS